jgi:hypothetical protein
MRTNLSLLLGSRVGLLITEEPEKGQGIYIAPLLLNFADVAFAVRARSSECGFVLLALGSVPFARLSLASGSFRQAKMSSGERPNVKTCSQRARNRAFLGYCEQRSPLLIRQLAGEANVDFDLVDQRALLAAVSTVFGMYLSMRQTNAHSLQRPTLPLREHSQRNHFARPQCCEEQVVWRRSSIFASGLNRLVCVQYVSPGMDSLQVVGPRTFNYYGHSQSSFSGVIDRFALRLAPLKRF